MSVSQRPGWVNKPKSRRVAVASFNDEVILHLFRSGQAYRVEGGELPDDARIVGVEYSLVRGGWQIYVESQTFEPVPENTLPPEITAPRIYRMEPGF